jgi:glycogen synthase
MDAFPLRVLRLCSVFEAPPAASRAGARFDAVGGMQNHTGQLARALDARGVRQTVVTAWRPGARRVERLGDHGRVLRLGVPVRFGRQLYSLPTARLIGRVARRADLVHVHLGEDLAIVPLGLAAARRAGCPLVITVHCSTRHTLRGAQPKAVLLRRLGGAIELHGQRRADAVIALATPLAERLAAGGIPPERIHVIPSGVDPGRFLPGRPDPTPADGRPRVVFVGRLAHQKGVDTLLRAARLTREAARIVIVGDGPLRTRLERNARAWGLDDVRFAGFVPHADVPAHLEHADVLVLPSEYEELGSVLVEAMQAGLPIVATRVGGIPDLVDDGVTGRLVARSDAAALAGAIDDLVADPALARRLGEEGRRRAAGYAWDSLADRVLGLYRSLLPPAPTEPDAEPEVEETASEMDTSLASGR